MQLGDLERYDISPRIIDLWRARQGEQLLAVQKRAIRSGLLEPRRRDDRELRMIITAPTSSGKSFCAELAMARALNERKRVVMLFPLKALVEEKYRMMRQTYARLRLKLLILTSDHPENDRPFAAGDYHVTLAIYEKFDLALTARLDLLQNIGLIVIDEVQMISEPDRGAVLERLLTKLLASKYQPDLLALSAVLADRDVTPFSEWLGADLVEESSRPRDLWLGVAADGCYRYRSYNNSRDGRTDFVSISPGDDLEDTVRNLASQIKADGGSTLIFVRSRAQSMALAIRLAAAGGFGPAPGLLEQLVDEEPSKLVTNLGQLLRHGVAFHNSDLSSRQRKLVEAGFVSGEIRILCATTTLALGVNLPADTVYLETVKYVSGSYGERPELVPLSRAEFENMAGRAGRLIGDNTTPGRAIVMADSDFESDLLWKQYIAPPLREPLLSGWGGRELADWILDMLVTRLAGSRQELGALFDRTLFARLQPGQVADIDLAPALEQLAGYGLVLTQDDEIVVTEPGRATARSGLTCLQAVYFLGQFKKHGYPETGFGWLCLALGAPDWSIPPGFLSWYDRNNNRPVQMLYQRLDFSVEEAVSLLPENHRRQPLAHRSASALKAALLLDDWMHLNPASELEDRYQIHLGQIQALGATAGHLLAALATLVHASDLPAREQVEILRALAFATRFGLPPSMRQLHRKLSFILTRSDLAALHRSGIESLEELCSEPIETVERLIINKDKLLAIQEVRDSYKEEVNMQGLGVAEQRATVQQPQTIEIDGSYEADRYLVRINGFPVHLTGKSFKYLTKLAWTRINDSSGWIYKEDIEIGFNQARYLYRMKNEINAGFKSSWPVVENNRLGYYRLRINPENIRLNVDRLKVHPDYELRVLFGSSREAVN